MLDFDQKLILTAREYLEKILPGATPSIEEIELGPNNATWLITFSFPVKPNLSLSSSLADSFAMLADRKEYKTIILDAKSGAFKAMLTKRE